MKKHISALALILIVLSLGSCKKKLTQFYIDYNSSVTIQSTVGQLVPFSIYTPDIETNSEVEFESNNTNKDRIESIFLDRLTLTITSPQNEDFSFLNSIELFISSPDHTEQKVAFSENISPNQGGFIECDLVDLDLQRFVKDDRFTLRINTVTDETIPNDIDIDVYSKFFVDAKLIK